MEGTVNTGDRCSVMTHEDDNLSFRSITSSVSFELSKTRDTEEFDQRHFPFMDAAGFSLEESLTRGRSLDSSIAKPTYHVDPSRK